MKYLVLKIFVIQFLISCSQKLNISNPCTKESILNDLKKRDKKLFDENLTVIEFSEDDSLFRVTFKPINQTVRGGAGYIEVEKGSCKLVKGIYYQ